ncbi:MAG: hypothetical protein QOF43_420 [Gaiellaceae bacterium]|nr:hypothetical protein [Gaiellaceae bacterium]
MATMPPDQPPLTTPPPPTSHGYTGLGRNPVQGAILPVPGNAELAVWLLVEIVLAIVAAVSDGFDAHGWAVATTWLTAAYILSRGVAKASRVLEQ